jgi:hypothetical protein
MATAKRIYNVKAPTPQDAIQMALDQLKARQQRAAGVVNAGTMPTTAVQRTLASMVGPLANGGLQQQAMAGPRRVYR